MGDNMSDFFWDCLVEPKFNDQAPSVRTLSTQSFFSRMRGVVRQSSPHTNSQKLAGHMLLQLSSWKLGSVSGCELCLASVFASCQKNPRPSSDKECPHVFSAAQEFNGDTCIWRWVKGQNHRISAADKGVSRRICDVVRSF